MELRVYLDFETASSLDVTEVGAYVYAQDPSTSVRLMCWEVHCEDGMLDSGTWYPHHHQWGNQLLEHALKFGTVWAHNATFDRQVMVHCVPDDLPKPTFNQWRCTAALARSAGLPGSLADAGAALELEVQKADSKIMKKLADRYYRPTNEEIIQLRDYCAADVRVAALIHQILGDPDGNDLFTYQLNEHVNDRGVRLDVGAAASLAVAVEAGIEELNAELRELTNSNVTKVTQTKRMADWLSRELGMHIASLDKAAVIQLLELPGLQPQHRRALEIRQVAGRSSVSKFQAMLDHTTAQDDRMRGMFIHAGAGQTGRFSSKGVQLHNMTRDTYSEAEAEQHLAVVKQLRQKSSLVYGSEIVSMASRLVRSCLVPAEGNVFVVADYAGVEARGLPWLAGNQREVQGYRDGEDKYVLDATSVFNCTPEQVDPYRRQVGKVVRLACGFGGGHNALLAMAKGYGMNLHEDDAYLIANAWHEANPWARGFGQRLEAAAIEAMNRPGFVVPVAGAQVWYRRSELPNGQTVLYCCLPSGRVITYHRARLDGDVIESWRPRFKGHERLWFGIFSENVTQATCNDLLRYGMAQLQAERLPLVAHVHDEFVIETVEREGLVDEVKAILERTPQWAADFPLAVKPEIHRRYGK